MDVGLCPSNYHDYPDDEIAIQREYELGDSLTGPYKDPYFPANGRSLYFDPTNPPKGALPNDCVLWCSICEGEVIDCENPITFCNDRNSALIEQGALGNSYLLNALRLLTCQPESIHRLIVSDRFAKSGLYTIKFYKAGSWRYVHIDDRIPCRQSGKVNYCRNINKNETFAMIIEKAYAKLHGSYEALSCGLIEKVLQELTPAASIDLYRVDRLPLAIVCDTIWDALERGIEEKRLIGCARFTKNPLDENPSVRQGISLGKYNRNCCG